MVDLLLLNMPLGRVERPSLPLGLLTSYLQEEGLNSSTIYANLRFFERVGIANHILW